jgi:hypothetical protein
VRTDLSEGSGESPGAFVPDRVGLALEDCRGFGESQVLANTTRSPHNDQRCFVKSAGVRVRGTYQALEDVVEAEGVSECGRSVRSQLVG